MLSELATDPLKAMGGKVSTLLAKRLCRMVMFLSGARTPVPMMMGFQKSRDPQKVLAITFAVPVAANCRPVLKNTLERISTWFAEAPVWIATARPMPSGGARNKHLSTRTESANTSSIAVMLEEELSSIQKWHPTNWEPFAAM